MKKRFFPLVCIAGIIILMLGLAGFWCLRVTPVTVINLSHSTLRDVEIDLQGKKLEMGTLEYRGVRKAYGVPGSGSMMAISLISEGRAMHRDVDYAEGSEGEPQIVLIFSADNIVTYSVPGRFLK